MMIGPIIRIGPNEVHIQDSEFYETLYAQSRPGNKLTTLAHRFNNPHASFSTVEHSVHRNRRAALNPFFSKAKIAARSVSVQHHMNRLVERIKEDFSGTARVLSLDEMWGCWTTDLIIEYCFEKRYQFIERDDLKSPFATAMIDLLAPVHFVTQFPGFMAILTSLPDPVIKFLQPEMTSVIDFNNVCPQILSTKTPHHFLIHSFFRK